MRYLILLVVILSIFIVGLYAQNMGPEYINLKEKYAPESQMPDVLFPHWMHQSFVDCQICHTDTGALRDWRRWKAFDIRYPAEFHSAFCGYCHDIVVEEGNQNTCSSCHYGNE
jgi:c(7)-type cytochrome triheme protein